jgi:O-antigen ligase
MVNTLKPSIKQQTPGIILVLLALLAFSTFLSDTKFIPSIRNNVGMFEMSSLLLLIVVFAFFFRDSIPMRAHPLILLMGLWFVVSLLSLININISTLTVSTVAVVIVLFHFLFTLTLFNVILLFQPSLRYLLRFLTISAVVIGLWVLIDQLASPEDFGTMGPFRGRSHAGIYMMGAFWIVLIFRFWPGIANWEKWLTYPALALVAYTIAASLRQSVYTAMIFGLVGLTFSFLVIRGRERFNLTGIMLLLMVVIGLLFVFGGNYLTSLSFFRREALGLEGRLTQTFASEEDEEFDSSFDAKQRQGAIRAFIDHPILGIGWMGFYRSEYSPTGNELHSTPLRFMAELGVVGLAVYLSFLVIVLGGSVRLFFRARQTPYQLSAFVLMVAFFAEVVSHWYNRMFTDRPYWVLLVIFLVFEAIIHKQERTADKVVPLPSGLTSLRLKPMINGD